MRAQDREVQGASRNQRKLFERRSHLRSRHRSLAQEVGGQGVLIWPKQIRGCEQTRETPLRYGSVELNRREARIDVQEP
jgi:hypothetical protein